MASKGNKGGGNSDWYPQDDYPTYLNTEASDNNLDTSEIKTVDDLDRFWRLSRTLGRDIWLNIDYAISYSESEQDKTYWEGAKELLNQANEILEEFGMSFSQYQDQNPEIQDYYNKYIEKLQELKDYGILEKDPSIDFEGVI